MNEEQMLVVAAAQNALLAMYAEMERIQKTLWDARYLGKDFNSRTIDEIERPLGESKRWLEKSNAKIVEYIGQPNEALRNALRRQA